MNIKNTYVIHPNFMHMEGVYDRNAKLCTLVTETNRKLLVDKTPLAILNDSIKCIGFDLRGAMETARLLLGNKNMCPIMINPIHNICVFPSKSSKHHDTMWFNPVHITRTYGAGQQTQLEFTNGSTLLIPAKLYSFNNKLQTAEQFRKMIENGNTAMNLDRPKGA